MIYNIIEKKNFLLIDKKIKRKNQISEYYAPRP